MLLFFLKALFFYFEENIFFKVEMKPTIENSLISDQEENIFALMYALYNKL